MHLQLESNTFGGFTVFTLAIVIKGTNYNKQRDGKKVKEKRKKNNECLCGAGEKGWGIYIHYRGTGIKLTGLKAVLGLCRTVLLPVFVSSSSTAPCSLVSAMVVHIRGCNFSTTDSSLRSSSVSTDATLWDSPAPQRPGELSRTGHTVVAVCLGFILVAGFLGNFFALLIFAKFRSLWTPINLILLNISLSDTLVCVFGTPFSFAASVHGRWLIGDYGCKWYGFANSLFGE